MWQFRPILLYFGFILFIITGCNRERQQATKKLNDSISKFISIAECQSSPYSKRVKFNKRAIILLLSQSNDSVNRMNIFKAAHNFYDIYEFENFKKYTVVGYKRSLKKNDKKNEALAYRYFGVYSQNIMQNDSALYFYIKAEKIYRNLNDYENLCRIFYDQGLLQYFLNDFLGSEVSAIKALKISKKLNLRSEEYKIYSLMGLNSYELNEYSKSITYHRKSFAIAKAYQIKYNKQAAANSLNNIGIAYLKSNAFNEAIRYFNVALRQTKLVIEDPQLFTCIIDNLAYTKFKSNDYKLLPHLYLKSSSIRDSLNIDQGKNFNKLYLSEYYAAVKDTPKAITYAHEALNLSREFRAPNDMLISLKQLTIIDKANAMKYSNQYIAISDSMQQRERLTRNKFAKIAYETEEITQEKDEAVKQKGIYFAIAVTILAFGLMLFIILTQRGKQKELVFIQNQQKKDHEIYQLIESQQSKIDEGRQIEKKRIAQDLHDGIMNKLASTRFNLFILNKKTDTETIKKCIPFINGIHDIEKEIRNIAHDLNNEVFSANDSFKNIIVSLFNEQKALTGAKWHIEIDPDINWEFIKSNKKIHIYRILQEILQNIHKHSKAGNIIISIFFEKNKLFLEIYDDGIGFSLNGTKKGIGLQNIFSRIKECSGKINIKTKKGQGTTIAISIPTDSKTIADNGNTHKYFNS